MLTKEMKAQIRGYANGFKDGVEAASGIELDDIEKVDDILGFIREYSKRYSISQQKLAEIGGINSVTICRWMGGTRKAQLDTVMKILDELGFDIYLKRRNKE